ncbi:hypothetical protein [Glycomyces sp. NPDC048151]|uniref:hypothetical protein n=1 Tax=Glycomyces sp. NPDC048151 TaxID=3364002 RepID=UPI00372127C3
MDPLFTAAAARGRALLGKIVRSAEVVIDGAVEAYRELERERERERSRDRGSGFAAAFAEDTPHRTEPEAPYSFKSLWKERLVYTDPGGTYEFQCGWGNFQKPFYVYIPAEEDWGGGRLHASYDELLARLRAWSAAHGHIVVVDPPRRRPPVAE